MQNQTPDQREAHCPICRREFRDVVVGLIGQDGQGNPAVYGLVRRAQKEKGTRWSDQRLWLDSTLTCRRGHRLQVPAGRDLERILERAPSGEPIYLPKALPPRPMVLTIRGRPR